MEMIRDGMGIVPINRHWYTPEVIARRKARRLFDQAYSRGCWRWLWSALSGRPHQLLHLATTEAGYPLESSIAVGRQIVRLDQIRGSLNRSQDFDDNFYPIQAHTLERWLRVAIAHQSGVPLPPVELIRAGDIYYVVDGHHRLSVARAVGQVDIEANVRLMINRRTKMTHTIFVESTAKEKYQNLLQQTETYRQVKQLKGQQPGRRVAVLAGIGQALVAMGQKLQASAKQKAAGSV